MKFSRADFLLLRWNLLAICAVALTGALVLYRSGEYADASQRDLRQAVSQLNDARIRLASAQQDRENRAIYAHDYRLLNGRGIIGNGQRLDWMEGLENIRRQNLAADFRFNIAPQKTYTLTPPMDSGSFDIHYSEMKLQFDLLHEGQLLDFFAALRGQIKGWYQLEGCTLKRVHALPERGDHRVPQLKAECSGGWVTLKNRHSPQ